MWVHSLDPENPQAHFLTVGDDMGFWGLPINVVSTPTDPMDSDRSTVDTIHQMIAIAKVSARSPKVISIVDSLLRTLPSKPSKKDLVRVIYWWVKNHVTYVEDERILAEQLGYQDVNQELLIPPDTLLSMPQPMGDCDDFSMLIASLMVAAKIPVGYVTIAVDPETPNRFSHVYCVVQVDGEEIYLDASHGSRVGWQTNREIFRKVIWGIN